MSGMHLSLKKRGIMKQSDNQNGSGNNNNNNFFNQNPILIFAIFSILSILIFKNFADDGMMNSDGMNQNSNTRKVSKNLSYYDFKELVKSGGVNFVNIGKTTIRAINEQGNLQTVYVVKRIVPDETLLPLLEANQVKYAGYSEENWLSDLLFGWILPVFIFFGIWMLLTSRMQKSMGGGMLGMGKGQKVNSEKPNVKFDDVAGNDEAKEEVKEIIDFLRYPDR